MHMAASLKKTAAGIFLNVSAILRKRRLVIGFNSKRVTSLVLRMSGMAFEPMETDSVQPVQLQEPLPQVNILLLCKTGTLPLFKPPLIYGLHDV